MFLETVNKHKPGKLRFKVIENTFFYKPWQALALILVLGHTPPFNKFGFLLLSKTCKYHYQQF